MSFRGQLRRTKPARKPEPARASSSYQLLKVGKQTFRVPASVKIEVLAPGRGRRAASSGAPWLEKPAQDASGDEKIERSAYALDARARAVLGGLRASEQDLRSAGGAYELDEVRRLLRGVSRQAVAKQVKDGSLLAVPGPGKSRRYPALQFNADGSTTQGLKRVLDALPSRNPWMALNFLVNADDLLGGRKPIELLREGRVDEVVDSARRLAQQGA